MCKTNLHKYHMATTDHSLFPLNLECIMQQYISFILLFDFTVFTTFPFSSTFFNISLTNNYFLFFGSVFPFLEVSFLTIGYPFCYKRGSNCFFRYFLLDNYMGGVNQKYETKHYPFQVFSIKDLPKKHPLPLIKVSENATLLQSLNVLKIIKGRVLSCIEPYDFS